MTYFDNIFNFSHSCYFPQLFVHYLAQVFVRKDSEALQLHLYWNGIFLQYYIVKKEPQQGESRKLALARNRTRFWKEDYASRLF